MKNEYTKYQKGKAKVFKYEFYETNQAQWCASGGSNPRFGFTMTDEKRERHYFLWL